MNNGKTFMKILYTLIWLNLIEIWIWRTYFLQSFHRCLHSRMSEIKHSEIFPTSKIMEISISIFIFYSKWSKFANKSKKNHKRGRGSTNILCIENYISDFLLHLPLWLSVLKIFLFYFLFFENVDSTESQWLFCVLLTIWYWILHIICGKTPWSAISQVSGLEEAVQG